MREMSTMKIIGIVALVVALLLAATATVNRQGLPSAIGWAALVAVGAILLVAHDRA